MSSVTNMNRMFRGASAFNQDIGGWNMSSVTIMYRMFERAAAFNKNIGGWDNVSSVISNMFEMFRGAIAFNQDIGRWDVSSVTTIGGMFYGASAFNQNLCDWREHNFPYNNAGSIFGASGCEDKSTPTDANDDFCQSCQPTSSPIEVSFVFRQSTCIIVVCLLYTLCAIIVYCFCCGTMGLTAHYISYSYFLESIFITIFLILPKSQSYN